MPVIATIIIASYIVNETFFWIQEEKERSRLWQIEENKKQHERNLAWVKQKEA